ncbi:unnamed protein product [Amaranthus hypochondriacus]
MVNFKHILMVFFSKLFLESLIKVIKIQAVTIITKTIIIIEEVIITEEGIIITGEEEIILMQDIIIHTEENHNNDLITNPKKKFSNVESRAIGQMNAILPSI